MGDNSDKPIEPIRERALAIMGHVAATSAWGGQVPGPFLVDPRETRVAGYCARAPKTGTLLRIPAVAPPAGKFYLLQDVASPRAAKIAKGFPAWGDVAVAR